MGVEKRNVQSGVFPLKANSFRASRGVQTKSEHKLEKRRRREEGR